MSSSLQDIEAKALQLPVADRRKLAARLLQSLEPTPQDSPDAVAKAWDEEIARRISELDGGRTQAVSYHQVRAELRALIGVSRRP
jgi:putative addiction module component (TIGR02574 family)